MTRTHQKSIAGPAAPEPGRAYLLHSDEFRAYVENRRDEAKRAVADLKVEIEGYHQAIERRNIDTARANEKDSIEIVARNSHLEDYEQVIIAADAALAAKKE